MFGYELRLHRHISLVRSYYALCTFPMLMLMARGYVLHYIVHAVMLSPHAGANCDAPFGMLNTRQLLSTIF